MGAINVHVEFGGRSYDCRDRESVLEALLRQGADFPFSCRKGICLSCLMRADGAEIPHEAQEGLRDTLRQTGHFLACQFTPAANIAVQRSSGGVYVRMQVRETEALAPAIRRIVLEAPDTFGARAGQFINIRRADGLVRSYSLAGVDGGLEVHVQRMPGGIMSNWLHDGVGRARCSKCRGRAAAGFTCRAANPNRSC